MNTVMYMSFRVVFRSYVNETPYNNKLLVFTSTRVWSHRHNDEGSNPSEERWLGHGKQ